MFSTILSGLRASRLASRSLPQVQQLLAPERIAFVQQARFLARKSRKRQSLVEDDDEPEVVETDDDFFPRRPPTRDLSNLGDTGFLDMALEGHYDDEGEEERHQREEDDGDYGQTEQAKPERRTGRGFVDPWDLTKENWTSRQQVEDLPDWTPDACSRICLERVQLYPGNIPKLTKLSRLPLPPPAEPHPGHGDTKTYVFHRKRKQSNYISEKVANLAKPKMEYILRLPSWQEKQDAVDELFESIEFQLKDEEEILSKHPKFSFWVERAVEEFLEECQTQEQAKRDGSSIATGDERVNFESTDPTSSGELNVSETNSTDSEGIIELPGISVDENIATPPEPEERRAYPTFKEDAESLPIFMDVYQGEEATQAVPPILYPLKPNPHEKAGRMVEEWELSPHKTSKRIMLRQCMRKISRALEENESVRVFVSGRKGVGKTAALAAIVASARESGYIVLYIPDGQRMSKRAPYVEPNRRFEGLYDVPFFTQELCEVLLTNHEADLERFPLEMRMLEEYFTEGQMEYVSEALKKNQTLASLMQAGKDRIKLSPTCFTLGMEVLKNQTEKPFLIVMDEFNCYFQKSIFYHGLYDPNVKEPIPHELITLFKPLLESTGVSTKGDPKYIKRGGIIVAITESHAVPRKVTDELVATFVKEAGDSNAPVPLNVVEVPRYSTLEVDHILANFEATGVGMLRFNQGETLMNANEVGYLRSVSSCVGQRLMDACMM